MLSPGASLGSQWATAMRNVAASMSNTKKIHLEFVIFHLSFFISNTLVIAPREMANEKCQLRNDKWKMSYGCTPTVAFLSSLPQPTTAPRIAVATDLTMT